jgi:putative heme-binding domain-containing protein
LIAAIQAIAKTQAAATPGGKPDLVRQFNALAGALDGLEEGGTSLAAMSGKSAALKDAVAKLTPTFDAAREAAIDDAAAPEARAAAAALLGRGAADEQGADAEMLVGMLTPQTPENVQSAAVASLSRIDDEAAPKALLTAWPGMTPALRAQTLDAFLQHPKRVGLLLDAIEKRKVLASDLDAPRRRQLVEHQDKALRARAENAFAGAINPDRQKVIDQYSAALKLQGDPNRGREFFAAVCATCHKIGDVGVNVGPDLLSVADHSPEYYLLHVLDPNRAVEAKYTNYVVETKTGKMLTGVLTGETGNSLTLTGAGGKPETVLRADLKRLRATPLSAMPEGLEVGRTPQDFADLIAYLTRSVPPPERKTFEGNKPEVVKPSGGAGVIRLLPSNAEVYGPSLVIEPAHGNLGWWSSPDDHAAWTVETPAPGAYDVTFEFACAPESAGNAYLLSAGKGKLAGKVPSTGSWDTYRKEKVGRIDLAGGGPERITLRSDGNINGALIDLKSIELTPAKD